MSWLSRILGRKKETVEKPESAARPAASTRSQPPSPRLATLLAEFDAARDVGSVSFVWNRSENEVRQVCAYYPLDTIRLGLERGDVGQLARLERITNFAMLLSTYESVLENQPELGLPASLDHKCLADILLPRLIAFIDRLRTLPMSVLAPTVSAQLYDLGAQLMGPRPRDALICLEVSRTWPSPREDHDLLLCGCYSNIAKSEKDPVAINEGIRIAKDIVAGKREASPRARDMARGMLETLERLKAEVSAEDESRRDEAINELVGMGKSTVESLIAGLQDEDRDVRKGAAEGLVQIGEPAVEAVIQQMREVQARLSKKGGPLQDSDYELCRSAEDILTRIGRPAVKPLITFLSQDEFGKQRGEGQCTALETLEGIEWQPDDEETRPWFLMARKDWEGCVALGTAAVEPLIAALNHRKADVTAAAARALGRIRDMRAVEPLIDILQIEYYGIRYPQWAGAAEALGELGDPRAVDPLISRLQVMRDWRVRMAAAKALGKIGDSRAVEPLVDRLDDGRSQVREAAAEALEAMGWQPADEEAQAWFLITKGNWKGCVALGTPAVEPLIAVLLRGKEEDVRTGAANALAEIGDPRAEQALVQVMDARRSEPASVREAAAEALRKLRQKLGRM